jgi:hypothetical protein
MILMSENTPLTFVGSLAIAFVLALIAAVSKRQREIHSAHLRNAQSPLERLRNEYRDRHERNSELLRELRGAAESFQGV